MSPQKKTLHLHYLHLFDKDRNSEHVSDLPGATELESCRAGQDVRGPQACVLCTSPCCLLGRPATPHFNILISTSGQDVHCMQHFASKIGL